MRDFFRKFYIWHEDVQNPENGEAYFGPFRGFEMNRRLNDAYADGLASFGNIECVRLSRQEAKVYYINPRSYWMEQLKKLQN